MQKLARARQELEDLRTQYRETLRTGAQWQSRDGSATRSVTNHSLSSLASQIRDKEREVMRLEALVDGSTHCAFRVGVKGL